jgi:glycosyltransferase involved in cell wall biosynthesis
MGTPFLSIIIPAYNASESLGALLESLSKSSFKRFEVIIGDDASNQQLTVNNLQLKNTKKRFSLRVVRLLRNKGPAAARNAAAKRARGNVLVFLDADVTVYPDTLAKIAGKFKEDRDLTAITGVWDKHQKSTSFFPQFKALRDWSYWTNERDSDGYYYLFSTRNAAVRREVFLRLGGFNEAFRQMEDVELTYRIAKRYAIIFAPDVRVHHEFEGFLPVVKKYFWRSFYWTKLYRERRKFDPVATTMQESMAGISGVMAIACGFLWLNFSVGYVTGIMNHEFGIRGTPVTLGNIIAGIGIVALLLFILHVALLWKFLRFVYQEKGVVFMGKAILTGLLLYCIIVTGSLYYFLRERAHMI